MDQVIINRELLRQVLDAFETYAKQYPHMWKGYLLDAEQALRKALEQETSPSDECLSQPAVEPVNFDQIAADRYKVVEAHESLFHRWAVVAGNGKQQLYLGRELECQNMARKFAGAFLDGAWLASQHTAPQAQQPAEVPFLTDKEILEMADDGVFLGNVKEVAISVESAVRKKAGLHGQSS